MLDNRRQIILFFIYFIAGIYILRLFYLQIIDDSYQAIGSTNAIKREIEIPLRGQIYDRTGKLIVANVDVYDLYITPKKVKNLDTLRFCQVFGIDRKFFDSVSTEAKEYNKNRASLFLRQLSKEDHAGVINAMVDFQGFHFEQSFFRTYPAKTLANTLGYIGEISKSAFEKQDKRNPYYRRGDYIGLSGLEKYYENELRGTRGVKFKLMNVKSEEKGSYKDGAADTAAVIGKNLYTTIDVELQQLADSLMKNKLGSLVAIEPATGEILAMGSYPTYDPNELSGRNFKKKYNELQRDPYKPLINRPLMGFYRPGSTFKLIQAAIGLHTGALSFESRFPDGAAPVKCHSHPSLNGNDLHNAIRFSCNPYFYHAYRKIIGHNQAMGNPFKAAEAGYQEWESYVRKFGYGEKLGIDLPSESRNPLWSKKRYDKVYGQGAWKYSNIASLSIGEGELSVNILKLANQACIFANRGHYYTPHLVKKVGERGVTNPVFTTKHDTGIEPKYFEFISHGMQDAASQGTFRSGTYTDIVVCGKTGTSQNPGYKDNAIFICFAPRENPKIAIAVMVEYSGFGGTWSGPVAALMAEKYIKRSVKEQAQIERVRNMSMLANYPKKFFLNAQPIPEKPKADSVKILKPATAKAPSKQPLPAMPKEQKETKVAVLNTDKSNRLRSK